MNMRYLPRSSFSALLALAVTSVTAIAQDTRPIAFTNARLLSMAGDPVEAGTLVVRDGKIEAIGKDAVVPAGARIVDCTDMTIMPGLVSAVSRAGLTAAPSRRDNRSAQQRGRRGIPMPTSGGGGGGAQDKAATKVVDGIYAKQSVFGDLLRIGITTLALTPQGSAFPGLGAILRPDGKTLDELTLEGEAFVQIGMARDAQTKKLLKGNFEAAQKVLELRKKPPAPAPEEKKTEEAKPEAKPAEAKADDKKDEKKGETPPKPEAKPEAKPQEPPKPQAKPAPPKNPNHEVLADLLDGKRRAIVEIGSAAEMLHWQHTFETEPSFPRTLLVQSHNTQEGTIDQVLDQAKAWKCAVLLPPLLSSTPRARELTHPARTLHEAGIEIGFLVGDNEPTVRQLFFRLMELVRSGLPADVALRGVTLVPAKALGVDSRVGTLEVGKDADLLVFHGDPLSPTAELRTVWLRGQQVADKP